MNIDAIKQQYMKWVTVFRSWDQRRQMMTIGFALLFYVYFLHSNAVLPAHLENLSTLAKIAELEDQVQDLKTRTNSILTEVQSSIANPRSQKALAFREELDELDKKLVIYNKDLVSAKDMSMILRSVLSEETGLELVNITSLPSVDILANANVPSDLKGLPNRAVLYKRGAKLVFQGGYFETINYLKKLENYGKRIFWDDFSYTVVKYPTAQVALTVYTLTSEEGWVGG